MKLLLIAFHLFMVLLYLLMGGILLFTSYLTVISGVARILLAIVIILYATYRAFTTYKNLIQRKKEV